MGNVDDAHILALVKMSFKWCNIQAGFTDLWSQGAGTRESGQLWDGPGLSPQKQAHPMGRTGTALHGWSFCWNYLESPGLYDSRLYILNKMSTRMGETDKRLKQITTQLLIQITMFLQFKDRTSTKKSWTLGFIVDIVVVVLKLLYLL